MERIRTSFRRIARAARPRAGQAESGQLPQLAGEFDHDDYPARRAAECLAAYRDALAPLRRSAPVRALQAELERIALANDALANELDAFSQRAAELSAAILALTAAAKPLQQPGIGVGDSSALRDSLAARAAELQAQRDAYEVEAAAYDARIRTLAAEMDSLRADIQARVSPKRG